jgi:hypothetical protein
MQVILSLFVIPIRWTKLQKRVILGVPERAVWLWEHKAFLVLVTMLTGMFGGLFQRSVAFFVFA